MDTLSILLQTTYSLSLLRYRLRILKSHFNQIFFVPSDAQEQLTPADIAWLNSLPKTFLEQFNESNFSQIMTGLENSINKLQALTLYLPFEINDQIAEQIGQKARITFNQLLLLDIKYDPNLIAGCALVWKGIYKDFSLKAKLGQQKEQILESFKKYLR